jgi:plastocyanin
MRKSIVCLALFAAAQAPVGKLPAQPSGPETVTVTLSNFKFTPDANILQHARSYRLHLVNASGIGHDFTAPDFFAASTIAQPDRALVTDGKVRLAGKASADVTLTPEEPGVYTLHCSHFMHSGMGMNGHVTVT